MKTHPLRLSLLLSTLALAGSAAPLAVLAQAQAQPQVPAPTLTPEAGFAGDSTGEGELWKLIGGTTAFHVASHGAVLADGRFRLDQTVTFAGQPPEQRTWLITTLAPGRYTGTLSDATGRVAGVTQGRHLVFDYRLRGGLFMHQTLWLAADGRTLDNVGRVSFLGLPVASLHETITRADPATP